MNLPYIDITKKTGVIKADDQWISSLADDSIKDIYDALFEIISNSGDSYFDTKAKYGAITVEYSKKKRTIRIKDDAQGMSYDKLLSSFSVLGKYSAAKNSRGLNSRGAKDCRAMGLVRIYTIKDNKLSTFWLDDKGNYGESGNINVSAEQRSSLSIKKNGSLVELENTEAKRAKYAFPHFEDLCTKIRHRYQLHGFTNEESVKKGSKLIFVNIDCNPPKKIRLETKEPEKSEIIHDLKFNVPGYENYKARFIVKKSKKPNQRKIIIMSNEIATHEETFLSPDLTNHTFLENYYGYLICDGISDLARQYKKDPDGDIKNNPTLVLDQNRQEGLIRKHPFATALLQKPRDILREIVREEEEKRSQNQDTVTKELNKKTKEMEKILSEILKETGQSEGDEEYVKMYGYKIFGGSNLLTNTSKQYTIWVNKEKLTNTDKALLELENPGLEGSIDIDKTIQLKQHPKHEHIMVGSFSIKVGSEEGNGQIIFKDELKTIAHHPIKITENIIYDFKDDLQFEHPTYTVNENQTRRIKLYAKSPDLVKDTAPVNIEIDNNNINIKNAKNIHILRYRKRTNYAVLEIEVSGKFIDQSSVITAKLGDISAQTLVTVRKKNEKNHGPKIEYVKEDLNGHRSMWVEDFTKLHICTTHKEVKKFYNPKNEVQSTEFWVLYTDIITDAFAAKQLDYLTKNNAEDFQEWDQLRPYEMQAKVVYKLNLLKKDILLKVMKTALS